LKRHIIAQKRKPLVIQWNFDFFFFVAIEKKGGRGPHTQIRLLQIDTFFSVSCQWQLEKLGKKEWEKCHSSGFVAPHSAHFLRFPDEMCAGAAATDDVPIMRALNAQFPFTLFYAALRIIPFSPIVMDSATPLPGN